MTVQWLVVVITCKQVFEQLVYKHISCMCWPEPMAAIECKLRVSNYFLKIQTD